MDEPLQVPVQSEHATPSQDRASLVLALLHRLMLGDGRSTHDMDALLRELATVFGVRAAGLVGILNGRAATKYWASLEATTPRVAPWPWQEWPELLDQVRQSATAVPAHSTDGRGFLFAASNQHDEVYWLLWLDAGYVHAWTD